MRKRGRPSRLVQRMMHGRVAQAVAERAQDVREHVSENLLLARMCMEAGYVSDRAIGSLISGLRIVATVAEAEGLAELGAIIDAADAPAEAIVARFQGGGCQAEAGELVPISAAIGAALEALEGLPDAGLALAYELDRGQRERAREAWAARA